MGDWILKDYIVLETKLGKEDTKYHELSKTPGEEIPLSHVLVDIANNHDRFERILNNREMPRKDVLLAIKRVVAYF